MDNLLSTTPLQLTVNEIIINLILSLCFGILIALIYKKTHKGVSYSQSFVLSLVLVTLIASTVIMVIGNSITRAFGLIGAFSVIRFRTAVKETRDIAFLFFCLVEGMAAGTGNYQIAAASLILFAITIFTLTRSQFGKYSSFDYVLSFVSKTSKSKKVAHLDLFDDYLADHLLLSLRSGIKTGEVIMTYNIRFNNQDQVKEFLVKLKKTGASRIELISSQNDVDY